MSGSTAANVASQAGLISRARVWLESVPLVTRSVLLLCTALCLYELVFGAVSLRVCLMPFWFRVSFKRALLRVFTSPFFHVDVLHILANMLSFVPMGTVFERKAGSLGALNAILAFVVVNAALHTGIALASDGLGLTRLLALRCSLGFSGVIFAVDVAASVSDSVSRSFFGFTVPAHAFPWVALIVMQVILPGVSFLGHLAGILSGYLYVFGLLRFLILPDWAVAVIEGLPPMTRIVHMPSYVVGPQTGVLPTTMHQQ
eukprot:m51a1_g14485 hypothetical protein (258) ;mRNA; r:731837-732819